MPINLHFIYINTIKVLRNWHQKLLSLHTGLALSSESVEVLQSHVISQWHKLGNMKPCQLNSMTSNGKDPCQLKQQLSFPVSRFPPLHQAVGFKQHLEQSWLIKWVTVQKAKLENIYEDSTKNNAPEAHKFLTYGLVLHASHKAHSSTYHCNMFEHQYRLSWCTFFFFFFWCCRQCLPSP